MKSKKNRDILQFALLTAIVILINVVGSFKFGRLDLTSENRYTLNQATIDLLEQFDDELLVEVYLKGDFPAGFQRLRRETRQMLDEFRAYNPNIQYQFINPNDQDTEKKKEDLYKQLRQKGLRPYQLQVREDAGSSRKTIFPGALMRLGDKEIPVSLLIDQLATRPEKQINASIQNLEYALANGVKRLVVKDRPLIGFLQGHGELKPREFADLARSLSANYNVNLFNLKEFPKDTITGEIDLARQIRRMNRFDALAIAKPRKKFNKLDKYLLDQFIMNGGKTVWMIDPVHASMDSLSKKPQFMSFPIYDKLNLSDMLFRYGVRINSNLVTDLVSAKVADREGQYPWIYFPLVMPQVKHPITKDLNAIKMQFASTIDTVKAEKVDKTYLLRSSPYARPVATPHLVTLGTLYNEPDKSKFRSKFLPMAVLLEGKFTSLYKNRILPKASAGPLKLVEESKENQMVVIADGDIARNQVNILNPNMEKGVPLPLGYDQFTGTTYGNKDLMLNVFDYLLDETGLISIRSRDLKIRLLDNKRVEEEKLKWQIINTGIPVGLVLLFGLVFNYLRKRRYARIIK